jgi:hypothetical protein
MTDQSKTAASRPRKPYASPILVKRDRLARITAADTRVSGIVTDGAIR